MLKTFAVMFGKCVGGFMRRAAEVISEDIFLGANYPVDGAKLPALQAMRCAQDRRAAASVVRTWLQAAALGRRKLRTRSAESTT